MALESPGADIVGFEHKPRSSADKAAVSRAIELLEQPTQLMRFIGGGDCKLNQATARLESEDHDDHGLNEHGHDDHAHDDHGHDDHAHDDHGDDEHGYDEHAHDDHGDEEAHSEFVAEYVFDCGNAAALSAIEFTYFEQFGNAESLDIVLIDGSGQRRVDVDRANPVLSLTQ